MSLRGPKGRGNLLCDGQKKPSLCLRLLPLRLRSGLKAFSARNDMWFFVQSIINYQLKFTYIQI